MPPVHQPFSMQLSPCPFLPPPREDMDWRAMSAHGERRDASFYLTALTYGHTLWQRGLAARAILCLDRAFGADVRGDEPEVREWPLPYQAMRWFLQHAPPDRLVGNPRVHFQHYADRLREPRRDQRKWRAWACWAITRRVLPHLPGDSRHLVREPSEAEIASHLDQFGLPGETALWRRALE